MRPLRATLLLVLLLAATGHGQGRAEPASIAWSARLEQLHPDDPMAYFALAEEVADAADDDGERDLAVRLYALAGQLDTSRLGRSVCLALADLERSEHGKRRLRGLARLLGRDTAVPAYLQRQRDRQAVAGADRLAVEAVAEALGHYRLGEGNRALAALRRSGAAELLTSLDDLLPGGVNGVREDCRVYRSGESRPNLTANEVTTLLRIEAALLAGDDRRWVDDLLLARREPLLEVDPDQFFQTLGVDPRRCVFSNGRWTLP